MLFVLVRMHVIREKDKTAAHAMTMLCSILHAICNDGLELVCEC